MHCLKLAAVAVVLGLATLSQASAQTSATPHLMVAPADLKWAAAPGMPCNAQLAVIEGPMNEAKPFTFRLKFPADCKIPPHYHPAARMRRLPGTARMPFSAST
jgi:hypothetical protein